MHSRDRAAFVAIMVAGLIGTASGTATADTLQEQVETCLACHGPDADQPDAPILDGQPALALRTQLDLFRQGARGEMPMTDIASTLSDDEVRALSDHFAAQPPPVPSGAAPDPELQARGAAAAARHRCSSCHLPGYVGGQIMPRLAGQREGYLLKAMRDYKSGARVGSAPIMPAIMADLADDDLQALAHYLAHLEG